MNTETLSEVNALDFVEKYYDGYSSCDEICLNNDLQKIVDGEINGHAEKMYHDFIEETGSKSEALKLTQQKLHESNAYIFQKAIEDYQRSLSESRK